MSSDMAERMHRAVVRELLAACIRRQTAEIERLRIQVEGLRSANTTEAFYGYTGGEAQGTTDPGSSGGSVGEAGDAEGSGD